MTNQSLPISRRYSPRFNNVAQAWIVGLLLASLPAFAQKWSYSTVEGGTGNNFSRNTSLAIDASGVPHVAYFDNINDDLKYAYWDFDSGYWNTFFIDSSPPSSGVHAELTMHPDDYPTILFNGGNKLYYAVNTGNGWGKELVTDEGSYGPIELNLAYDSEKVPHISYHLGDTGALYYGSKVEGVWTTSQVHPSGTFSGLALDSSDGIHIAFHDSSNDSLKFASLVDGDWTIETIDDSTRAGWYCDLQIDPMDRPQVAYYDMQNFAIRHAIKIDGQWEITVLDVGEADPILGSMVGWELSLAVDADSTAHVSYYDMVNTRLLYTKYDLNQPVTEIVHQEANEGSGRYTSIALDSWGVPWISFIGGGNSADLIVAISESPFSRWFPNAENIGDGYYIVPRFGTIYGASFPWIYHMQLGWMWCWGTGGGKGWLWHTHPELGWMHWNPIYYPSYYLFRKSDNYQGWIYHETSIINPIYIYFYNFQEYRTLTWD